MLASSRRTPLTRNGASPRINSRPIGAWSPKNSRANDSVMTQTRPLLLSSSSLRGSPETTFQPRIPTNSGWTMHTLTSRVAVEVEATSSASIRPAKVISEPNRSRSAAKSTIRALGGTSFSAARRGKPTKKILPSSTCQKAASTSWTLRCTPPVNAVVSANSAMPIDCASTIKVVRPF